MATASSQHLPRLAGLGAGLVVMLVGVALMLFHERLTRAFNALYAELPGKFQYPRWFVRTLGALFTTFGVALLVASAVLGR
jgi:hypothetical protein